MTPHIGVEITGYSGRQFAHREVADECLTALECHGVVVYRAAAIGDEDLVAFSRLLGEVVVSPTREHEYPEISTITLDPSKTNGVLAGYRQGNFLWHFDGATDQLPQKATLLAAREVDPNGGDTEFATTYAAYAALPEDKKSQIANLRVVHSFAAAQRRSHPDAPKEEQGRWERMEPRTLPLVWSRQNGRRSMLLGATAGAIVGWSAEESVTLLADLQAWCTQPQFVLRHNWQQGDLVIWDNTGLLHRALPFEPTSPRLMHRTTLVGVEAVN